MLTRVLETIKEYKMFHDGDNIVIGVSGGADSVALMHILCQLQNRYGLKLSVVHLNHMFRGRESDQDAEYVEDLCKSLGIPVYVEAFDIPDYIKKTGLSSEDASRIKRYELYQKVARHVGASKIALGHNADDQAETVLMRILRGTGSTGLAGIPPKRMMDDLLIIRPLIDIRRNSIDAYCAENALVPRVDSTNLKPIYMRNKIRLELLPCLEKKYSESVVSRLATLADVMRHEDEYMESETERVFKECRIDDTDTCLRVPKLMELPIALARRVMRRAFSKCKGDTLDIEFGHVQEILNQLSSKRTNWQLHLPAGLVVQKEYDILRFVLDPVTERQFKYLLKIPGTTFVPEAGICFETEVLHISDVTKRRDVISSLDGKRCVGFDHECLQTPLFMRSRQPGDRIDVFGMQGSKKVKDVLIDEKVPPHKRAVMPLLAGDGIVYWVAGLRASRKAQITDTTSEIVVIRALRTSQDVI